MTTSADGAATTGPASPGPVGLSAVLLGHRHDWADMGREPPCDACDFYDNPLYRAALLRKLLTDLAIFRHSETIAYASAFLAATGTEQAKIQAARFATVDLHLSVERCAADVAACQQLLKGISES